MQDNSLLEIIQLINEVTLVPNQARLEDKGKNPVRARAVVATTNTKHLNAHAHFARPVAVQRRLPFVLTVRPKPEFACDNDPEMIDSAKLSKSPIVDDWPDFWNITVERVLAASDDKAVYDHLHTFTNIHKFLFWLKDAINRFDSIQRIAGQGNKAMREFKVCKTCWQVSNKCVCEEKSSDNEFSLQANEWQLS